MNATNPDATRAIHPLFRGGGLYRHAADESLFATDDGERSVREFFEARGRARLRAAWGVDADELPAEPQEWGLGRPVDEAIHSYLRGQAAPIEPGRVRRPVTVGHAAAANGEPTPALLTYRMDRDGDAADPVVSRASGPAAPFTGCGLPPGETYWSRFEAQIGGLPDDHACLLLVFTREVVGMLRSLLDASDASPISVEPAEVPSEEVAIRTITRSLQAATLDDPQPRWRALRVSTQLALVPTFQRVTAGGHFLAEVSLKPKAPPLDHWTWLALCVGPRVDVLEAGGES
ncbi:MAG: hypothetical protein AB7I30_14055 [Isosphaeraceae bacterium]